MGQIISAFLQIVAYLASNRDQIKQLILDLEALMPGAMGADKANIVKGFIGTALGIEAQLEQAWVFVAPIFNHFVSATKPSKTA